MSVILSDEQTPLLYRPNAAADRRTTPRRKFAISKHCSLFCRIVLLATFLTILVWKNVVTCPFVVFIIRHAETTNHRHITRQLNVSTTQSPTDMEEYRYVPFRIEGRHNRFRILTNTGIRRSKNLAKNHRLKELFSNAVAIYAARPSEPDWSLAEMLTMEPMSRKTGISLSKRFSSQVSDIKKMIHEIKSITSGDRVHFRKHQKTLERGTYGQSIVICWDNKYIPLLVDLFGGCLHNEWPKDDFDSILTLHFNANDLIYMEHFQQNFTAPLEPTTKWNFTTQPCDWNSLAKPKLSSIPQKPIER